MLPALPLVCVMAAPAVASATPFTVQTTVDAPRQTGLANPCDCTSTLPTGECTLRAAVETANACPQTLDPFDEIFFAPAVAGAQLSLTEIGVGTATASEGDLDVTEPLVVRGTGQNITAVQGDRVWDVDAPLTLQSLSMDGGEAIGAGDEQDGGCLRNVTTHPVTLDGVDFVDCLAKRNGGAVWTEGELVYTGGAVLDNRAKRNGGGVYVFDADATIHIDAFANNDASRHGGNLMLWETGNAGARVADLVIPSFTGGSAQRHGGGLYTTFSSTFIDRTLMAGNEARRHGGAIYAVDGTLTFTTGAITGNVAGYDGGALYTDDIVLEIRHSAVFDNHATNGGGIAMTAGAPTLAALLTNVTLAENTASFQGGGMLLGRDTSAELDGVSVALNDADRGGGISVTGNSQGLTLSGSYLAANTAGSGVGPDCISVMALMFGPGASLIQNDSNCGAGGYTAQPAGITGTNTDPTAIMPEQTFVVEFDPTGLLEGTNTACLPGDQRGVTRGTPCDIGAYEQP